MTETREDIRITASRKYFDGDDAHWKNACYALFECQMLHSFAKDIQLKNGDNGKYIEMIFDEDYFDSLIDLMAGLGYQNICAYRTEDDYFIGMYNVEKTE